jgi:hypothetical protein
VARRGCSWYRPVSTDSGRRFAPRHEGSAPAAAALPQCVAALLVLSLACNTCFTCSFPALTNSRFQDKAAARRRRAVSASAEG